MSVSHNFSKTLTGENENNKEMQINNTASVEQGAQIMRAPGAIRHSGEKFTASRVANTALTNVSIYTNLGCSGFNPQHSISYRG
jgi:hypothetical protein